MDALDVIVVHLAASLYEIVVVREGTIAAILHSLTRDLEACIRRKEVLLLVRRVGHSSRVQKARGGASRVNDENQRGLTLGAATTRKGPDNGVSMFWEVLVKPV